MSATERLAPTKSHVPGLGAQALPPQATMIPEPSISSVPMSAEEVMVLDGYADELYLVRQGDPPAKRPDVKNNFCCPDHKSKFQSEQIISERAGKFMPMLSEYISTYVAFHYRKPYGARNALSYFFQFLNKEGVSGPDQVTPKTISRFIVWESKRGNNPGIYLSFVSTFFDWLIAEDRCQHANPVIGRIHNVKRPERLPRPYSEDEMRAIWELLDKYGNSRVRLACAAGEEGGLRIGELCNVHVADVNIKKQTIFVRTPNKTMRERSVFIGDKTRKYYEAWMKERDPSCGHDYLLHNTKNRPSKPNALHLELRRVLCKWERQGKWKIKANEDGLDNFNFHRLRHTMATRLMAGGADAAAIMSQGGWVTSKSMCGYSRVDDEQARRSYNKAMQDAQAQRQVPRKRVTSFHVAQREPATAWQLHRFQRIENIACDLLHATFDSRHFHSSPR